MSNHNDLIGRLNWLLADEPYCNSIAEAIRLIQNQEERIAQLNTDTAELTHQRQLAHLYYTALTKAHQVLASRPEVRVYESDLGQRWTAFGYSGPTLDAALTNYLKART